MPVAHVPVTIKSTKNLLKTIKNVKSFPRLNFSPYTYSKQLKVFHLVPSIIVTVFWKTNHLRTRTEIHLLPVRDRHMHVHYPDTKSTRLQVTRSAFTDGFLLMLLNHKDTFHGPGRH